MYRVDITTCAEQDLIQAVEYISAELGNPIAAARLLDDAVKAITALDEMPLRHPLVADETLARQGFRFFAVGSYIVFYIVREEQRTVVIERFLYGRRNWGTILNGN